MLRTLAYKIRQFGSISLRRCRHTEVFL